MIISSLWPIPSSAQQISFSEFLVGAIPHIVFIMISNSVQTLQARARVLLDCTPKLRIAAGDCRRDLGENSWTSTLLQRAMRSPLQTESLSFLISTNLIIASSLVLRFYSSFFATRTPFSQSGTSSLPCIRHISKTNRHHQQRPPSTHPSAVHHCRSRLACGPHLCGYLVLGHKSLTAVCFSHCSA